jgi:hypothetical protein
MGTVRYQPIAGLEDFDDYEYLPTSDLHEARAKEHLRQFFDEHREEVFFSRQIEVQNEDVYFHWITNRAIRELVDEGVIHSEVRRLRTGGTIKLLWMCTRSLPRGCYRGHGFMSWTSVGALR